MAKVRGDALSWHPWQSPPLVCFHYAKVVTPKPSCALTAAVVAPIGVLLLCIFVEAIIHIRV